MKPINIEMSAFGPYKEKIEIDFTKLGERGIFLITGDTGAGKTSIFDAIVFALFGEVSGSNRQVSSIRSDFSEASTETYVVLKFSHKGKVYIIRRMPAYERPKKNGEGFTKNIADAWIKYEDKTITGIGDVNEKVEEILGINAKQFKQISMLAQGEFLKILFAESKDRTEIFRKIFDTDIYNNITYNLRNRRKESEEQLISLKTSFITNSKNIRWTKNTDFFNIESQKELNQIDVKDILKRLDIDIKLKLEQEKQIKKRLENVEREYKIIEDKYKKLEEENKKIDKLKLLNKNFNELKEQEEVIKSDKKLLEINQRIKEKVKPIEELLNKNKKELEKIKKLEEQENKKNKELKINEKLIIEKEEKLKRLKIELKEYQKIKKEIKKINEEKDKINNIIKILNEKNLLTKQYDKVNKEFKEISKKYNEEEDKFFREQAGIIAEKLEENKPCPVCGSTTHPNIAHKSNIVLSKEDLEKLNEEKEKKSEENEKIKNKITELKAKYDIVINSVKNKNDEFSIDKYSENINQEYNKNKKLNDKLIKILKELYLEITSKEINLEEFLFDELNEEFDKIRKEQLEELTKSNTLINQYNKNLKEKLQEIEILNKKYIEAYNKLGYKSYNDYMSDVINDGEMIKKQKEIDKYNKNIIEIETKIEETSNSLEYKEKADITECKKQLEEKLLLLNNVKNEQIDFKGNLDNNQQLQRKLNKNSKELLKQIELFINYDELYKTASGTLPGKRKIEFEQYVQATYFDIIIKEANKRLVKMTDNRYVLIRKETSEKTKEKIGLDLEVIDNYSGKKRDVKSLSGGEAFKAALALSLGVSDVIQSYSGGVVVDTLFIDEGFGSLDTESREQAINTLNLLTDNDKIIGIISHVTELKERIDKKIIIEKSSKGSKVKFEV